MSDNGSVPVRFGVVGYGFGARYFHTPLIRSSPECELVGVVTASAERKALVEHDKPGTPTFEFMTALRDAGVEAVAISTPTPTHTEVTEQALRLGFAVVCDKAFALTAGAARHTVDLADERGLLLSPYQNRRWDSDFRTVQKLVADGSAGHGDSCRVAIRALRAPGGTRQIRRRFAARLR